MPRPRPPLPPREKPRRRWPWLLLGIGLVLLVGGGGYLAWSLARRDPVAETVALQRSILDAASARERSAGIDELIRRVDRLPRQELQRVREALGAESSRVRRESIDRYFSAAESERPALLDADIDRLLALQELWFAVNPQASWRPPSLPRSRPRRGEREQDADARKLAELYTEALAVRARQRGLDLPR